MSPSLLATCAQVAVVGLKSASTITSRSICMEFVASHLKGIAQEEKELERQGRRCVSRMILVKFVYKSCDVLVLGGRGKETIGDWQTLE
jgi:hypothetical protein